MSGLGDLLPSSRSATVLQLSDAHTAADLHYW